MMQTNAVLKTVSAGMLRLLPLPMPLLPPVPRKKKS